MVSGPETFIHLWFYISFLFYFFNYYFFPSFLFIIITICFVFVPLMRQWQNYYSNTNNRTEGWRSNTRNIKTEIFCIWTWDFFLSFFFSCLFIFICLSNVCLAHCWLVHYFSVYFFGSVFFFLFSLLSLLSFSSYPSIPDIIIFTITS
jgi:hypothetical protein